MSDTIVYKTVSVPGGMDGLDPNDKGGIVTGAYLNKLEAQKNPNSSWETIVPIVVDISELAKDTLNKLDPVARLAVETYLTPKFRGKNLDYRDL